MDRGYDYRQNQILFVDDEEMALKYFKKSFSKDFDIITATNADQAWELIDNDEGRIGVVISDQRMPGRSGVDLLTQIRKRRPDIVRILTTAYSELESAIDSVNSGAVFRYITKPWELRELRGVLLRAMEFYLVQRERDILLREKLSVLQRMIIMDRMRSFAVLAASLTYRIRNSMAALKMFFDFAPITVREHAPDAAADWTDLWTLAQEESQLILQAVDQMLETTIERDYAFKDEVVLSRHVEKLIEKRQSDAPGRLTLESDDAAQTAPLKADGRMIDRLLEILLTHVTAGVGQSGDVTFRIESAPSVWGTPGVSLRLTSDGPDWGPEQLAAVFAALHGDDGRTPVAGLDMLAAFFIAYHHGGQLLIHPASPRGPGFEVLLPFDPDQAEKPAIDGDWLERIFTNLEPWETVMA